MAVKTQHVTADEWQKLPCHPGGRQWNVRHVIAAKLRAEGHEWSGIAAELGSSENTVMHYPLRCDGWHLLHEHFRAHYLARLEDELLEPGLKRHRQLLDSANEFVAVQAVSLMYAERRAKAKELNGLLKQEADCKAGDAAASTTTTITVVNEIQEPSERAAKTAAE
ncbi:MAG: hypothetical protein Q8R92_21025 [Deltaproteobacteria bacterium]|nr:hypothetical protein [Deltaproteobacteria bacterium]